MKEMTVIYTILISQVAANNPKSVMDLRGALYPVRNAMQELVVDAEMKICSRKGSIVITLSEQRGLVA